MRWKSIRGQQGSWEAAVTWEDGSKETLACLHQHFWTAGSRYDDPWTPALRETGKFAKHVALIRSKKRVILTTDSIDESKHRGEGFFQRTGYVAIFDITDFVVDDAGMRLRFTERYNKVR